MNDKVIESNPILSRYNLQKSSKPPVSVPESTVQQTRPSENLSVIPKQIYKPPNRSQSSKPNSVKNVSSSTLSTNISSTVNNTLMTSNQSANANTTMSSSTQPIMNKDPVLTKVSNESQLESQSSATEYEDSDRKILDYYERSYIPQGIAYPQNKIIQEDVKCFQSFSSQNLIRSRQSPLRILRNQNNYNDDTDVKLQTLDTSPIEFQTKNLDPGNKSMNRGLSSSNIFQSSRQLYPSYDVNLDSINQNKYLINLEDTMLLEEKLCDVIKSLVENQPMSNECFEWWNYYFNCSLFGKLEYYFKDESAKKIIRDYINIKLLTIIICYDTSFDKDLLASLFTIFKSILNLLHQSFLILCEYILSKIASDSMNNIWVYKLQDLVQAKRILSVASETSSMRPWSYYVAEIKENTSCVSDYIRIILKNYPNKDHSEQMIYFFKNLSKTTCSSLNDFFRNKIMRVLNKNASVLASVLINDQYDTKPVPYPYLKKESLKEYTLVLDLDETLIHFKIDTGDENKGLLRLRPGLIEFLDAVGNYYELVVFTAGTQDYADPIVDAIEQDTLYFDYRLYRQHAVIVDNDFVKDITKLGRDTSKIIIVDNMPQNFRLQKENGIFIKTWWGEDPDDTALIDLLPILENIAKEKKDVRKSLIKYRDEILKKVSSNLNRQNSNSYQTNTGKQIEK